MKALLLAAGKSERLRPLLGDIPKPMARICGKPLLQYNIELLKAHGVTELYINLHYKPDSIREYFGDGSNFGVHIEYSHEETILGTAGAAKKLEQEFDKPFLVVYGDNISDTDITAMIAQHANSGAHATIAVFDPNINANTAMAGGKIEADASGRILRFIEGSGASPECLAVASLSGDTACTSSDCARTRLPHARSLVNAGIYVLEPGVLALIPPGVYCDFGHDALAKMVDECYNMRIFLLGGYCLGPDTPEAFQKAESYILAHLGDTR